MFNNNFKNKKVLITGHTGFKGSWLTLWLIKLEAKVIGISKDIPTKPSLFEECNLENKIIHYIEDIRNLENISIIIKKEKPDFLIHLAAQAIVSVSYDSPIDTISTNVLGTTNILEALRLLNHKCTAIIITSDKAYDNIEQVSGYKETDTLGGKDIYSGSKGAAELIIKSYYHSYFKTTQSNIKIAIARAGNVIGGGDWAKDRIVVDCMKAWAKNEAVTIRKPKAIRPWQHVLEPLSGYLLLASKLFENDNLNGEAFNFGPTTDENHTVEEILIDLSSHWNFTNSNKAYIKEEKINFHEANLLKLNCDKALDKLKWSATLNYEELIQFTSLWYYNFYKKRSNILKYSLSQINNYENKAKEKALIWTE